MSDHRNSTALPNVKTGEIQLSEQNDLAVAKAMRGLESSVFGLANMTSIMSDLVFDNFAGFPRSLEEQDRAVFCVNEVTSRVARLKADYLQALDAGKESPSSGPSAALMAAIEEVERTYSAWVSSVPKGVDLPDNDEAKAFDDAERRLINFSCRSYADVVTKVSYLHHRKSDGAATAFASYIDGEFAASFLASLIGIPAEEAEFQEPVAGTTDGSAQGFVADMVKGLDLSGVSDTGWVAVYDGLTLAAHGIEGIMQRPQCQERDDLNAAGLYLQAISDFLYNERRRAMEVLIRRPFNPAEDPNTENMVALQWLAYDSIGENLDELESFVTTARDRQKAHEEYRAGKAVRA